LSQQLKEYRGVAELVDAIGNSEVRLSYPFG